VASRESQFRVESSLPERYEALSRASQAICAYRDPKELFRVLADELRRVVRFDSLALNLYDEVAHKVRNPVRETVNGPEFSIPADFPAEATITWWVYRHQVPVTIASRDQETRFPLMMEIFRKFGVQSACVLPLSTAHRRLGGLSFGLQQPDGYSAEDVKYLSLLADHVALAVDIALRNEEQGRVEEELRRQKAHFERLFELAPEAIVLRDAENRVVRANREFTKLFGYTVEESLGRNIRDLIVPEGMREESERLREAIRRGERVNAELVRRRKDGSLLNVSFTAAPVSAHGGPLEIYSIYRDITERKRTEDALRRSEAYLSEGQRMSHSGSWARTVPAGEVYWSQESYRMFGVDPSRVKPTHEIFLNRTHPEDRAGLEQTTRRAILDRNHFQADFRIIREDGTIRHIHTVGHPVINAAGKLVEFVGTHIDVTEPLQARVALEKAFEEIKALKEELYQENVALRQEIGETAMFEEIVGKSDALRDVLKQVEAVASTDSTVIIYGETGTGKELIARAIHNLSARRDNAFVKLNCASIPTGLLESELFGHERGAFTGAIAQRIGRFELANRGTIFLDEIGEVPPELQPKLLRVLQEREFERLGSSRTLRSEARLIAATNRDLSKMVEAQTFRADLFYRLNVIPILLPPLRERPEDVPLLVQHFAELFSRRMNKAIQTIPTETMSAMVHYDWPGNVRELQNVIERAVILSAGGILKVPLSDLRNTGAARARRAMKETLPIRSEKRSDAPPPDRDRVLEALREAGGRVGGTAGAAARLGMKRTTLIAYMKRLSIDSQTVVGRHTPETPQP
jgi:PAS domain S-box-containing protein